MEQLVGVIAKALVDHPDDVSSAWKGLAVAAFALISPAP